ncbi:hypothetical protein CNR22_22640 [Sphingobacteriaceae bacterium]|nr:hypothetical protein CNR22_22640 [Sphingobacteriaceae bacterium]
MKNNIILFFSFVFIVTCFACHEKKHSSPGFSYHPAGYYYKLLAFDLDSSIYKPGKVAWVAATFKNQADSVFWDSYNNLNDKYYIKNDSAENNFFKNYMSKCTDLDSGCVLVKTKDFFQQQFKSSAIPYFCQKDSVVCVNFKVKRVYEKSEFVKIQYDLLKKEEEKIKRYYGTEEEKLAAQDPLGFYWIEHGPGSGDLIPKEGDIVTISYKGEFLNGRFLEKSGADFEFIYGTPDQLLPGLNYVISRLKLGENAKIILPSRLAFGVDGSSNATVPPFTPLVYEIKLISLKTSESTLKTKPVPMAIGTKKLKRKKR